MPTKVIRNGAVVEDSWIVVASAEEPLPAGDVIVPYALWNTQKESLKVRGNIGVWLNSDESPELIANDLDAFAVIAINFPVFTDGRGFSHARELRETYGYKGEIRAIGAFIRDQLFYMKRCGFNAFALETAADLEAALHSFSDFSEFYQAAVDQPQPLFRRR